MFKQSARYLVTTADERVWKFDRPVIFLGEWCRNYDRKHIWQDMDAVVAVPYGLGQEQKNADHTEARALEKRLFPILYHALNQHHGVQYSARFWQIVLGHWLQRYVDVMLNRVRTLEHCLQSHRLSGTTTFSVGQYAFVSVNSYAAILAFNDDRWNNELYIRILNLLGVTIDLQEVIDGEEFNGFCLPIIAPRISIKKRISRWGYLQLFKVARFFARKQDAFIINSYLPKHEEIKLQLALGQCPVLWVSPEFKMSEKVNKVLRESLANQVIRKSGNNLEDILKKMLFELLPICYLEGFSDLNVLAKQQHWPKLPKFIFTSNNFDTDEVFKLWAATKVESGTKYYIGQHGNYGVSRNHIDPSNEEITADKFLTWGWTDGLPQHIPAFVFKMAGRKAEYYNLQGGLLLIELHSAQRLVTWDDTAEFANYFEEQQNFVRELASTPKQQLTIRLHAAYKYLKWNEEARWQAFDPSLKIDVGNAAIRELIAKSRLVVHSYDSTGVLETLSQNIPTLAFWQNGFDHLRDSAKPYYQELVDAGVIHFSAESVAAKVNAVWDNVENWWGGSEVQEARKKFCDRYAKVSRNPASDLKLILTEDCQ